MKHVLYALAFLTTLNVQAASTGTLVLTGVVGAKYDLVVTPNSSASTLNISDGESAKLVATVNEKTNNHTGYKIKMSSANGGLLKNGTIDSVAYTLSYNNATAVTPSTTAATVKTSTSAALGGVNSDVKVTFTGHTTALAGTYSDTLTFSIEAP